MKARDGKSIQRSEVLANFWKTETGRNKEMNQSRSHQSKHFHSIFIQQIYIKHTPCVKHSSRSSGYSYEGDKQGTR